MPVDSTFAKGPGAGYLGQLANPNRDQDFFYAINKETVTPNEVKFGRAIAHSGVATDPQECGVIPAAAGAPLLGVLVRHDHYTPEDCIPGSDTAGSGEGLALAFEESLQLLRQGRVWLEVDTPVIGAPIFVQEGTGGWSTVAAAFTTPNGRQLGLPDPVTGLCLCEVDFVA